MPDIQETPEKFPTAAMIHMITTMYEKEEYRGLQALMNTIHDLRITLWVG